MNAALSIIDIQYVRFEVRMDGVTKIFDFVSNPTHLIYTLDKEPFIIYTWVGTEEKRKTV